MTIASGTGTGWMLGDLTVQEDLTALGGNGVIQATGSVATLNVTSTTTDAVIQMNNQFQLKADRSGSQFVLRDSTQDVMMVASGTGNTWLLGDLTVKQDLTALGGNGLIQATGAVATLTVTSTTTDAVIQMNNQFQLKADQAGNQFVLRDNTQDVMTVAGGSGNGWLHGVLTVNDDLSVLGGDMLLRATGAVAKLDILSTTTDALLDFNNQFELKNVRSTNVLEFRNASSAVMSIFGSSGNVLMSGDVSVSGVLRVTGGQGFIQNTGGNALFSILAASGSTSSLTLTGTQTFSMTADTDFAIVDNSGDLITVSPTSGNMVVKGSLTSSELSVLNTGATSVLNIQAGAVVYSLATATSGSEFTLSSGATEILTATESDKKIVLEGDLTSKGSNFLLEPASGAATGTIQAKADDAKLVLKHDNYDVSITSGFSTGLVTTAQGANKLMDLKVSDQSAEFFGKVTINGDFTLQDNSNNVKFSVDASNGNTFIAGNVVVGTPSPLFTVDSSNGDVLIAGATTLKDDIKMDNDVFSVDHSTGNMVLTGSLGCRTQFKVDSSTGSTNYFQVTPSGVTFNRPTTINHDLTVQNDVAISGDLTVTGTISGDNNNFLVTSSGVTASNVVISGSLEATGKFEVSTSGRFDIYGQIVAASTAQFAGGNLQIASGGAITTTGSITANSLTVTTTSTFSQGFTSGGSLSITGSGTLSVSGAINGGSISVTGTASASSFVVASDARLKTHIQTLDVTESLNIVKAVRPVAFEYKEEYLLRSGRKDHGQIYHGFLAQEVESMIPGVVVETESDLFLDDDIADDEMRGLASYKSVSLQQMLPDLWNAVRGLAMKVDDIEAENPMLQARIDALEEELRI
jgi:hypothetical protein